MADLCDLDKQRILYDRVTAREFNLEVKMVREEIAIKEEKEIREAQLKLNEGKDIKAQIRLIKQLGR